MSKYIEIIIFAFLIGLANYLICDHIKYVNIHTLDGEVFLFIDTCTSRDLNNFDLLDSTTLSVTRFYEEINNVLRMYDSAKSVVLYCPQKQNRSVLQVYKKLTEEFGIKNICILEGGIQ